ncbi:MAG: HAD-IB family hydrolase [Sphingopyxis sp.]
MQPISIFDLDRTITKIGTWSPFLLFVARRRAPWRFALIPMILAAMIGYKLGLLGRARLKEIMHRAMIGRRIDRAQAQSLAKDYARHVMASNIYAAAIALIQREQAAGRRVIIATASHAFYAAAIANALGVETIIATLSLYDNGNLTHHIDGENCYGEAKLRKIQQYFACQNSLDDTAHRRFYSDDLSDLPTFDWVDEPIAVNASHTLGRHAKAHGWAMLDWRR